MQVYATLRQQLFTIASITARGKAPADRLVYAYFTCKQQQYRSLFQILVLGLA